VTITSSGGAVKANVTDCADSSTWVNYYRSGKPAPGAPARPAADLRPFAALLRRVEGDVPGGTPGVARRSGSRRTSHRRGGAGRSPRAGRPVTADHGHGVRAGRAVHPRFPWVQQF